MDIDNIIKERRSIRHFKKKDIPWKKINEILESFTYAPCAGDIQNFRLIVFKNDGKLNKACHSQSSVVESNFLVAVCSDDSDLVISYKEKGKFFGIQNTAAGIQNMMLKAYSMKVGSCWIRTYDEDKIRAILKIPEKISLHAIVAFGYFKDKPEMPLRLDTQKVISFNEFGKYRRDPLPLIKK
ncbi:hypothetical protein HOG16_02715 [Candidatus Woesearchaeota archaeon]|jgi:nitroreductase|nr:hypothetical protein [Candidatus Woesearchaeota archaeon]MBT4322010.1 hypothetical protein [Candidatus Woesearchaeota archaeon]MBT4630756.1 hypothetical protein [Candidatus Woesearchaeota archaeon]